MSIQQNERVIFKSDPLEGIMAPEYFDLATLSHFWCRRRFEVLQLLAGKILRKGTGLAEVGCGNGILMRQIETAYDLPVVGFDLHEGALRNNISRSGALYCYDIHDRDKEFERAFDIILMFDVLEHIADEDRFLESAKFHLNKTGYLIANVPALQWLYSPYDQIQGHCRRYSIRRFESLMNRQGLDIITISYWGAPLVPIAMIRKVMLSLRKIDPTTYTKGFDAGSAARNSLLMNISRFERLPQRLIGTSIMAVMRVRGVSS